MYLITTIFIISTYYINTTYIFKGCLLAIKNNKKGVVLIYDRKGLTYDQIDPILYQKSREFLINFKKYYSKWISLIYVIHVINYYLFRKFILQLN